MNRLYYLNWKKYPKFEIYENEWITTTTMRKNSKDCPPLNIFEIVLFFFMKPLFMWWINKKFTIITYK